MLIYIFEFIKKLVDDSQFFLHKSSKELCLFGKEIGVGGWSIVYKVFLKGKTVAVKIFQEFGIKERITFDNEVYIMKKLVSPYVVRYYDFSHEKKAIIMEYLPKGSLRKLLCSRKKLNWQLLLRIMQDTIRGIQFLHQNDVIHCDLSIDNILLDANLKPKIADFGLSKKLGQAYHDHCLPGYAAVPKKLLDQCDDKNKQTYTPADDIYGLGVIFWALATRQEPTEELRSYTQDYSYPIPDTCLPSLAALIKYCWSENPSIEEVNRQLTNVQKDFLKTNTTHGYWPCSMSTPTLIPTCIGRSASLSFR